MKKVGDGGLFLYSHSMWHTYIIRSERYPEQRYIGSTKNLQARLSKHNEGGSPHTSKYRPWKLEVMVGFSDKEKALAFERYLKSGSGFSFAKRHF